MDSMMWYNMSKLSAELLLSAFLRIARLFGPIRFKAIRVRTLQRGKYALFITSGGNYVLMGIPSVIPRFYIIIRSLKPLTPNGKDKLLAKDMPEGLFYEVPILISYLCNFVYDPQRMYQ